MIIKNITKNRTFAQDYKLCNTFFSKAKGLMFSRKKNFRNLIFVFDKEKKIGLHMWFVFFPIDVVLLDKDKRVVEIKGNLRPFRLFNSKNKAKYVLELYQDAIKKNSIELEDKIEF
ncbi:DUF192 domain-containing protein [Candidatus Woesearchaeota archaeon]|jgi:uncharacterized protein|nr:DUF192 domain-containing protein [Candidatus Woesearchaeota archaeon]